VDNELESWKNRWASRAYRPSHIFKSGGRVHKSPGVLGGPKPAGPVFWVANRVSHSIRARGLWGLTPTVFFSPLAWKPNFAPPPPRFDWMSHWVGVALAAMVFPKGEQSRRGLKLSPVAVGSRASKINARPLWCYPRPTCRDCCAKPLPFVPSFLFGMAAPAKQVPFFPEAPTPAQS